MTENYTSGTDMLTEESLDDRTLDGRLNRLRNSLPSYSGFTRQLAGYIDELCKTPLEEFVRWYGCTTTDTEFFRTNLKNAAEALGKSESAYSCETYGDVIKSCADIFAEAQKFTLEKKRKSIEKYCRNLLLELAEPLRRKLYNGSSLFPTGSKKRDDERGEPLYLTGIKFPQKGEPACTLLFDLPLSYYYAAASLRAGWGYYPNSYPYELYRRIICPLLSDYEQYYSLPCMAEYAENSYDSGEEDEPLEILMALLVNPIIIPEQNRKE